MNRKQPTAEYREQPFVGYRLRGSRMREVKMYARP
jgi:hypothetical protein